MNIIKKIILVIAICISFIPVNNISAKETQFYVYTKNLPNHTEYAKNNLAAYVSANGDSYYEMELGQGIYIDDPEDYTKMYFPVFENKKIVGALITIDYEGVMTANYVKMFSEKLNELINLSSLDNPLSIVVDNNEIYGVVNNIWFNLNNDDSFVKEYAVNKENTIINVYDCIDFTYPLQTRAVDNYEVPFTIIEPQGSNLYCYSYAMGNILMNLGYSITPASIQSYFYFAEGVNKQELSQFLDFNGISNQYITSGSLSFDNVKEILKSSNTHIYIGAHDTSDSKRSHAFVLFAYSQTSGGNRSYKVWNPWYTYTQSINADTRIIVTKNSKTYKWDNGCIYYIKRYS